MLKLHTIRFTQLINHQKQAAQIRKQILWMIFLSQKLRFMV